MRLKHKLIAVAVGTAMGMSTASGQSLVRDEPEALRRLQLYTADLIGTLPDKDQRILKTVVLRASAAGNIGGVGAAADTDGTPFIIVNQGTQYAMQQLGQAVVLAVHVIKSDSFLMGYIRTLAYWDQFGERPMTALQFAEHYGVRDAKERLYALSIEQRNTGLGVEAILMLFITAHELAHHLNGDVARGVVSPETQREQEARADAWAAERLMALGHSPEMAIMSMQVMNQIERSKPPGGDLLARHPEALARAQELMRSVLLNVELKPAAIRNALAQSPNNPSFEKYLQALRNIDNLVREQILAQRVLDTDSVALQNSAKKGDIRSQLRLAVLHQTGEMDGVSRNKKAARFWAEVAALNDVRYEFFDSAYASYIAGKLVANDGEDMKRACYYMHTAASMKLTIAELQYARFKQDGICKN